VNLRRVTSLPFVVALAGSALLLYSTGTARPLWVDEEMLLLNVRDRGFLELAGPLWLDQSAPLGWLALERLLLLTFGWSEPAVRLLPAGFGIATLVTAAWIGRRWMGVAGATVFVALCATGQWLVFFTLELKHYSADLLGAVLIPAIAAWAIEDDAAFPDRAPRRIARWWIAAALAQWFSNGALFVTPLCATVVAICIARTRNRHAIAATLTGGAAWAASVAANYAIVLRHASANAYLREYWAFAFPPVAEGMSATLAWISHWFAPFAVKPAGSGLPELFWLAWAVGVGYAIASRRAHGTMIATVPLAALGLALLHVVPPFERIALWIVPSLYAGIAYSADAVFGLFRFTSGRARPLTLAASAVTAVVAFGVSGDVVWRGIRELGYRPRSNYGLDDRSSIRFLLANHRPGDAILTTHFGLAALWWYGRISVSNADRGGRLLDGSPIFEIRHLPAEQCDGGQLRMAAALDDQKRAAVYLAFRMNVEPVGFDELVLREAGRRWALDTYKEYAELSRIAIFDLKQAPSLATVAALAESHSALPEGCVGIRPAKRW
jgi:hypothetical protein